MYLSEWEIEAHQNRTRAWGTVNLHDGANILRELMIWTDKNSDGWTYWRKPQKAANALMTLLAEADTRSWRGGDKPEDCTVADLEKALRPIKAFFTRQGVSDADRVSVLGVYV